MAIQLTVISPFNGYNVGQIITDPATVAAILATNASSVVQNTVLGTGTEIITLVVVYAQINSPLSLAGSILGYSPTGLQYTINGGLTWTAVSNFLLDADGTWTGTGPIISTAGNITVQVRDSVNTTTQSAPITVTSGAFSYTGQTGIQLVINLLANQVAALAAQGVGGTTLSSLPPQSAGYPKGGYWVTSNGNVKMAPIASLATPTNDNLVSVLLVAGVI